MEWIQAFDILTIQETKLDKSFPDSQFTIDDYNMFRQDRKKGGGGIMVYIRKSIPSHRIRVKSNEVEAIVIDIQLGQQYMSLLCAYKPPAVTNNTFTNETYALLDSAIANRSNKKMVLNPGETIHIQLYYRLRYRIPHSAKLYGLPKLHKPTIPRRPTVSFCGSPTYQLSKHLTNILKPFTDKSRHKLQSTDNFIDAYKNGTNTR